MLINPPFRLLEKAKLWPENLGVGKPYDVDERIPNYLLAHCHQQLGNQKRAVDLLESVAAYTKNHLYQSNVSQLLGLKAIEKVSGADSAKIMLNSLLQIHQGNSTMEWIATTFLENVKKTGMMEKTVEQDFSLVKQIAEL